jgi:hypothetical protein
MNKDEQKAMYDNADKFINLANELAKSDRSGGIGVALRFAAARYSAYEASMQTKTLAEDKEEKLQLFAKDFTNMLQVNIEDYIKVQSQP